MVFGIYKRKKSLIFLICVVFIVCFLTACNSSPQETVGETPSNTTSTSPQIEVVLDIPEDFLDFQNYIGEDISLFGMEEGLEEYDGGTSSLYGHEGTVTVCVGWDGTTITRVVLTLNYEENFKGEEYDEVSDKLVDLFGDVSLDYGGIRVFSGLTEYDFSLWRKGIASIDWNDENREVYEDKNPNAGESNSNKIQNTQVPPDIGMTAAQVRASTWGEPSDINRTTTRYGVSEQWVYRSGSETKYIYFDNGVVTAIQE